MPAVDSIVNVTIQTANASPTQQSFGIPAILCYHTHNGDYIRTYSSLAGMVSDGFTTTEPAYYMATALLDQSPTVPLFKVIRGSTAAAMTATFTLTDTNVGDTVGFTVVGVSGASTPITTTATGNTTTDATTLAAISPPNGCTLTSSGAVVTLHVTSSGKIAYVSGVLGGTYLDTTASASPATDLTNALAVDSSWYGVSGEHQDATNIAAVASWAETNKRLHYYTSVDSNNRGSGTGICHTLKGDGYTYSYGAYSGTGVAYAGCATMANEFVRNPGTYTMAYKQLAGVPVDTLSDTDITNLEGNNANFYSTVSGVNITQTGTCASGLFVDLRRGIDALAAQIQVQIYNLLVTQPKVSYDPFGIAMIGAEVKSALAQFTATANSPLALLRNDPGFQPQVILPSISSVATVDIQARILRNVQFVAYAQNAVQTVKVVGSINF